MLRLEHIGIAVHEPEAVASMFQTILGVRPYKQETVSREHVRTHFIPTDSVKLELLEAVSPDSPVARFLEKRGEGLHHLSFEVADIHATMKHVVTRGFKPLSDEPRKGADGKLIFFLHPRQTHGVLIEICQSVPCPPEPIGVPFEDVFVSVLSYGDSSNPPLIVLLDTEMPIIDDWEQLFRNLEPHYSVLSIPLNLQDNSYQQEWATIDRITEITCAVLDFFVIEKTNLFGISRSCIAALRLANTHPDRIQKLVLFPVQGNSDVFTAHSKLSKVDLVQIEPSTLICTVDRNDMIDIEAITSLHKMLPNSSLAVLPTSERFRTQIDLDVLSRIIRQHL